MKSSVVIKGNRAGMTVILDPEVPYQQLLGDIAAKFEESARFWGSVQMTLTLAGRPLTPEQEFQIVNVITDHSQIEILCLVDQDASRMRRCEKALNEKLMELSSMTGQFYKGCLRAGEHLDPGEDRRLRRPFRGPGKAPGQGACDGLCRKRRAARPVSEKKYF